MIQVKDLSKTYKLYNNPTDRLKESLGLGKRTYHSEFQALKPMTFDIKKGETVGIIGKNGSGKSTLLKAITGVIKPTGGEIKVSGKVAAILELGTGFNPEYSGIENIYLSGTIQGLTKEQIDERLDQIIAFADIGDFIFQPVKTYSSGMFARLAFALNIHVEPDILIVDEALAVGDVKFNAKCLERFKRLKEKGTTILYVTHDVTSIRTFCDKALWINEGQLIDYGDTVSITSAYLEYMHQDGKEPPKINEELEKPEEERNSETYEMKFEEMSRWGSQPHLIKAVRLYNQKGMETTKWFQGESISIKTIVEIPKGFDLEDLSIAFAIKHTSGLDLHCSTTYDYKTVSYDQDDCLIEVSFDFENWLNQGQYYLTSCVETRKNGEPEYYDFIEGSAYIEVMTDEKRYGLINPPVKQSIRYLKN